MENKCQCKEANTSIYDLLNDSFEKKVQPLRDRGAEIRKLIGLSDDASKKRETVLDAQIIVLARNIEEATALDDENRVKNLQTELATVETELESLIATKRDERGELFTELKEIKEKIKAIADSILKESFDISKKEFIAKTNDLIDWVETICGGYQDFAS